MQLGMGVKLGVGVLLRVRGPAGGGRCCWRGVLLVLRGVAGGGGLRRK